MESLSSIGYIKKIQQEFKKCLHGVSDAGTTLIFKFRSGTHGRIEE